MSETKIMKRKILIIGLVLALGGGLNIRALMASAGKPDLDVTPRDADVEVKEKPALKPDPREQKIPMSDAVSTWGYYGVPPESPDRKRLCYALFPKPIDLKSKEKYDVNPARLWVCNIDGTGHRMLFEGKSPVHNGMEQSWVDNKRIVFCSDETTYIINADTGKIEYGPLKGFDPGHYARDGKVLLRTSRKAVPKKRGLYEFDIATGKMRLVMAHSKKISHMQYSPDGQKILFKVQLSGSRTKRLGMVNIDGSSQKIFPGRKPMHFQWFDDQSFFGYALHDVMGVSLKKYRIRELYRWDLDGKIVEYLAGYGCHGATRKDGKYYVGESWYGSNPIKFKLYARGNHNPLRTIFSHRFAGVTWRNGGRHHVNPSFSRDGMRIYYTKAVNKNTTHAFSYGLTGLVSPMK